MNNSRMLLTGAVVSIGVLFSIFMIINVMTDARNVLGQLAVYMAAGFFVLGCLFGHRVLWMLVLIIAFGDLMKRALVLYGFLSYMEIGKVLLFGPLLLAGISVSLLLSSLRGNVRFKKFHWVVFWVCVMLAGASSVFNLFYYNSAMATLKNIALGSSFFILPWIVLVSLRTPEDILRFIKIFLIAFFVVALVGIKQGMFGMSDFFLDYYESGFTIEGRQLKNEVIRIPSTMNAARSLSVTMSICLMFFVLFRTMKGRGFMGLIHPLSIICIPVYFAAMVFTVTRVGWVAFLIFPLCVASFGSKIRTVLLYATGVICLGTLVTFSEVILENWGKINSKISQFVGADTAFEKQATNVATLSARLVGWRNLTREPALWSAFGLEEHELGGMESIDLHSGTNVDKKSSGLVHDTFTNAVVKFGLVPIFFAFALGIMVLKWLHSLPFKVRDPDERRLVVLLLSCLIAVGVSGMTSVMHVPLNAFLFMLVGMMLSMADRISERAKVRVEAPERRATPNEAGARPELRSIAG